MAAEYFSIEIDPSKFRGTKSGVPLLQLHVLENIFLKKKKKEFHNCKGDLYVIYTTGYS